jgi:hypothetical protein
LNIQRAGRSDVAGTSRIGLGAFARDLEDGGRASEGPRLSAPELMVVKSSVALGQTIETPKLVEFDLIDIDRDYQRLRYLSLFAVVGKNSALMWHHQSV